MTFKLEINCDNAAFEDAPLKGWQLLTIDAPMRQELVSALRECVAALTDHVERQAKEVGVCPEVLCPCKTTTIARAHKILAQVVKGKREE